MTSSSSRRRRRSAVRGATTPIRAAAATCRSRCISSPSRRACAGVTSFRVSPRAPEVCRGSGGQLRSAPPSEARRRDGIRRVGRRPRDLEADHALRRRPYEASAIVVALGQLNRPMLRRDRRARSLRGAGVPLCALGPRRRSRRQAGRRHRLGGERGADHPRGRAKVAAPDRVPAHRQLDRSRDSIVGSPRKRRRCS